MGAAASQEDLEMLKRNTRFTEQEIRARLEQCTREYGPECKVRKDQFYKLYLEDFAPQWNRKKPAKFADSLWKYIFQACDRDNSGTVDFKELLLAIDVTNHGTPKEKLEWAFKLYDLSGDGLISEEEMIRVINAIHQMSGSMELSLEELENKSKQLFKKMDANDDDKVTIYEFMNCCLADKQIRAFLLNEQAD